MRKSLSVCTFFFFLLTYSGAKFSEVELCCVGVYSALHAIMHSTLL